MKKRQFFYSIVPLAVIVLIVITERKKTMAHQLFFEKKKNENILPSSLGILLFYFVCICALSAFLGYGDTEDPVIPVAEDPFPEVPSDPEERAAFYRRQLQSGERRIPRGWPETKDPALFSEYFRAQLIKQFGDRPEVHILADTEIKKRQRIPLTRDEFINYLEAQYALFPNENTLKTLEKQRQDKVAGIPFVMIYSEPGETVEQKIKRFLKRRQEIEEEKAKKDEDAEEEVHDLNE